MERVQDLFREGVMSHLDRLESLSQYLTRRQGEERRQEAELQEKREAMVRLEAERDDLRGRIRLQEETIQSLSARKEEAGPRAPNTQNALQDLRLEEMRGIMEALWFTGISGKLKDGAACFCMAASYEGRYLNSYYLRVNNMKSPQVARHSIPPFIPLAKLAEDHLPADLKTFLRLLYDQLNGYEGRKFQANQMEEKSPAYVAGSLQKNSLYTLLSFTYNVTRKGRSVSFAAKLLYGDIASTFPTEATVTCSDDESSPQEMIRSHVTRFTSSALHRALDSLTA
ncbi:centromere protein O-like [Mantella aurantiaca]